MTEPTQPLDAAELDALVRSALAQGPPSVPVPWSVPGHPKYHAGGTCSGNVAWAEAERKATALAAQLGITFGQALDELCNAEPELCDRAVQGQ